MVCRAVDVEFGTGTARALGLDGGPIGQMFIDKGAVGVDVFFVISGLVIFLSTEGKSLPPGRFLSWALLFRLQAPLLIVAALLFAVCQAWTGYGWISEFYRSDIVYEFLLGIAIGMTCFMVAIAGAGVHGAGTLFREPPDVPDARVGAVCRRFCRTALWRKPLCHVHRLRCDHWRGVVGKLRMGGKKQLSVA